MGNSAVVIRKVVKCSFETEEGLFNWSKSDLGDAESGYSELCLCHEALWGCSHIQNQTIQQKYVI